MLCDSFFIRVQHHFTAAGIDNDPIAGTSALVKITESDNSGKTQTSGDDRHV